MLGIILLACGLGLILIFANNTSQWRGSAMGEGFILIILGLIALVLEFLA